MSHTFPSPSATLTEPAARASGLTKTYGKGRPRSPRWTR